MIESWEKVEGEGGRGVWRSKCRETVSGGLSLRQHVKFTVPDSGKRFWMTNERLLNSGECMRTKNTEVFEEFCCVI